MAKKIKSNNKDSQPKSQRSNQNRTRNTRSQSRSKGMREGQRFKPSTSEENRNYEGDNDVVWHAASPELKRLVAAIPWAQPVGVAFPTTGRQKAVTKTWATGVPKNQNVPGILTITLRPSIGNSTTRNSPLNVAAWSQFSAMRKNLAGTFSFDPNDAMIYDICVASMISKLVESQRAYGIATQYTQENRYLSEALLTAMGYNALDVIEHLADFEYGINVLANKIAAFNVPGFVKYFDFHAWLYRDIYSEGVGIKDQLYMYIPDGFFTFQLDEAGAGMAAFTQLPNQNRTVNQDLEYLSSMVDAMWFDEDNNVISSLLGKAYGLEKMIKVAEITPAFRTPIVPANYYVLSQFKNATILPAQMAYATNYGNVVQDPNKEYLTYNNVYQISSSAQYTAANEVMFGSLALYNDDRILCAMEPVPTEDMVIESTRHTVQLTNLKIGKDSISFEIVASTSTPVSCYIWWYDGNNILHKTRLQSEMFTSGPVIQGAVVDYSQQEIDDLPLLLAKAKSFKYAPSIHLTMGSAVTDGPYPELIILKDVNIIDFDNYTTIDEAELTNLHEVAIMSELGVLGAVFAQ